MNFYFSSFSFSSSLRKIKCFQKRSCQTTRKSCVKTVSKVAKDNFRNEVEWLSFCYERYVTSINENIYMWLAGRSFVLVEAVVADLTVSFFNIN